MSVKTNAPHWSLWLVDQQLPELQLPRPLGPEEASGDWQATWSIHELDHTRRRTTIDGSLTLTLRHEPDGVVLSVVQQTPMYWGMGVETRAEILCEDDELLTPVAWTTEAVSTSGKGEVAETRGTSGGSLRGRWVHHHGVDESRVRVGGGREGRTTSWGLLAALPRLVAGGQISARFSLLDELVATRPGQRLDRREPVDVPLGRGVRRMPRWRLLGRGTPPVQLFTSLDGWPMLVCGLRRALVARSITPLSAASAPRLSVVEGGRP